MVGALSRLGLMAKVCHARAWEWQSVYPSNHEYFLELEAAGGGMNLKDLKRCVRWKENVVIKALLSKATRIKDLPRQ